MAQLNESNDVLMEGVEGAGDRIKNFLRTLQQNQMQSDQRIKKLHRKMRHFTSMNLVAVFVGIVAFFAAPLYWSYTEIRRLRQFQSMDGFPKGVIVAWQSEQIPEGWVLCDGHNDTPDLRNRFIYGWNKENNQLLQTGGSHQHTLSEEHLPPHSHAISEFNVKGMENTHQDEGCNTVINVDTKMLNKRKCAKDFFVTQTGEVGEGKSMNTIPRYTVLAYIMKV
eukprot:CAMPEP_0197055602 /NCGR_PEP_ID=MMETSP1384-20130603/69188_1 /TAXON_ID=29189 /ORGANISM="Ammonia sp." /LENGTH=222 /DNA_ID=CAMNT_0042489231 /DNA_START=15 /DNA_END=683 /DNA_ORIENTATION=-